MNTRHVALPPDLAAALAARSELGVSAVRYFPELASTNDTAAALAAGGAPDGTAVLADRQTAGRGRRGRAWDSPAAAGLYLSVILRGRQSPVVTLLAGVAVAEAVQRDSRRSRRSEVAERRRGAAGAGGVQARRSPGRRSPGS